MRIFAKDRRTATRALLALQERLLKKGMNLNRYKTEFAPGQVEMEELRSKDYGDEEYSSDEEDAIVTRPVVSDKPFDEFTRNFEIGQDLANKGKDAKDFCHFLAKRITLSERQPGHVEMLHTILTDWHGSAKHAAWRLVESFARSECPKKTRESAEAVLVKCLNNSNVTNYAKYRLLHYLVRPHKTRERYWKDLLSGNLRILRNLLPTFLAEKAFELNIIALYAMRCLGASASDLKSAVEKLAPRPPPLPIKNPFSLASTPKTPTPLLPSVPTCLDTISLAV